MSQSPHRTDKARQQAEEREKRLAEALRANLRRRKNQNRARIEASESEALCDADSHPGSAE